jgi:hypothetical protein
MALKYIVYLVKVSGSQHLTKYHIYLLLKNVEDWTDCWKRGEN